MMFDSFMWWPFGAMFAGATFIVGLLFFALWIWMIVDCAKRSFRKDVEKVIWLVVIVLGTWIGAIVYFIVVKSINQKGLISK